MSTCQSFEEEGNISTLVDRDMVCKYLRMNDGT